MSPALLMSGLEFDALPYEEGRRWELLGGELIAVSSATLKHQKFGFKIQTLLSSHIRNRGEVASDVEFALSDDTRVRPDVFVLLPSTARRLDLDRIPIPGAPDLAIEVISPTERPSESSEKVRAYLRSGVAEVWQVDPKSRTVEIHRNSGTVTLDSTAHVTSPLLPGFSSPVAAFFE
jgi:Uma2 family endonuclease